MIKANNFDPIIITIHLHFLDLTFLDKCFILIYLKVIFAIIFIVKAFFANNFYRLIIDMILLIFKIG
jgi:hypothetical protein